MIRRISCILLGLLLLTSAVSAQDNSTPQPQYYTVASGDTLSSIAGRYHTTTVALMRANGIVNADRVFVGTILIIPSDNDSNAIITTEPAPATTPTPTTESVIAVTPEVTTAPVSQPPSIGFGLGGEAFSFMHMEAMHQAAMSWMKVSLHWNVGDPVDQAQQAIFTAHAAGFKIMLEISGDSQAFRIDPPVYTQQFTDYLGQVAAQAPDSIEVWSGMNADKISAADYGKLLNAAFFAIKKANLQVLVISGALENTNTLGGQCTSSGCGDIPYLNALAEAGVGNAADCIGMRYTLGAVPPDDTSGDPRGDEFNYYYPTLVSTYASIFPNKQLCFTEIGYLVTGIVPLANRFDWAQNTTPELRAQWLRLAGLRAIQSGRIRLMIIYNMDAIANTGDTPATNYAIVNPDGSCSVCEFIGTVMTG